MKRIMVIAVVCMVVALAGPALAEKAPEKVYTLASSQLAEIGKEPVIVAAVNAENAKGKSLSSIQAMDDKWKATAGVADYMQALMDNECARFLKDIQNSNPHYLEIFVMDNQGANVCQTDKTSDFWQGDEAKFKNSFNNGKGGIFVDEVEFDDSVQAYISQVSVPVIDGGRVIGAITFGIDIDGVK